MKSGDTYRFSLSWPMATEEQLLAGEFLGKLGNKKSRFIVQLVCDYLNTHPEAMDPKETVQFIVSSTSVGDRLADMVRTIIQTELAGKIAIPQNPDASGPEQESKAIDDSIDAMFGNLDIWNRHK